MAEVEDAPPKDAAEGGTSSGGKKGRYRREKPWVRPLPRRAPRAVPSVASSAAAGAKMPRFTLDATEGGGGSRVRRDRGRNRRAASSQGGPGGRRPRQRGYPEGGNDADGGHDELRVVRRASTRATKSGRDRANDNKKRIADFYRSFDWASAAGRVTGVDRSNPIGDRTAFITLLCQIAASRCFKKQKHGAQRRDLLTWNGETRPTA